MHQTEISPHIAPTRSLRSLPSPASAGGLGRGQTIARIQEKMIGAVHLVLEQIERAQAGRGQRDPLRVFLMRRAANQAGLWDECAHRACKRARGCRRLHGQCLGRASEAARAEGRSLLARGKFDELLALLPPGRR